MFINLTDVLRTQRLLITDVLRIDSPPPPFILLQRPLNTFRRNPHPPLLHYFFSRISERTKNQAWPPSLRCGLVKRDVHHISLLRNYCFEMMIHRFVNHRTAPLGGVASRVKTTNIMDPYRHKPSLPLSVHRSAGTFLRHVLCFNGRNHP